MKGRNPLKGRHFAGSNPAPGSPVKPPSRTGSASGNFVGGGTNRKTAQKPEYTRRKPAPATNYTSQAEQFTRSAPEPFRNPQPSANPKVQAPYETGSSKPYPTFAGTRVSINDGVNPSKAPSPSRSKSVSGGYPGANIAAVGISGSKGRGSENGKVAGRAQPRKSGNPFTQGRFTQAKSTSPMFYGR
jgi:hypothetical protein